MLDGGEYDRGEVDVRVVGDLRELRHCSFDGMFEGRRVGSGDSSGCREECRCLELDENDESRPMVVDDDDDDGDGGDGGGEDPAEEYAPEY